MIDRPVAGTASNVPEIELPPLFYDGQTIRRIVAVPMLSSSLADLSVEGAIVEIASDIDEIPLPVEDDKGPEGKAVDARSD